MYPHIKMNEGFKSFPYYDTKWNETVAAGLNVSDYNRFDSLDWRDKDDISRPATQQQKDNCWNNLQNERLELQGNPANLQGHNYRAEYFEPLCDIRVTEDYTKDVYRQHVLNDLPFIRKYIPNFDNLDESVQDVVMDRIYNMGAGIFSKQTEFLKYAANNDKQGLINEAETSPIAEARRKWVKKHLGAQ